jgi:hypothetical protein
MPQSTTRNQQRGSDVAFQVVPSGKYIARSQTFLIYSEAQRVSELKPMELGKWQRLRIDLRQASTREEFASEA